MMKIENSCCITNEANTLLRTNILANSTWWIADNVSTAERKLPAEAWIMGKVASALIKSGQTWIRIAEISSKAFFPLANCSWVCWGIYFETPASASRLIRESLFTPGIELRTQSRKQNVDSREIINVKQIPSKSPHGWGSFGDSCWVNGRRWRRRSKSS